ncbi:MAG: phosphoadenosine phosphosulfate reductase family protein [Clostridiales bacterium]|jgi:3'-phosphoadenosine 5'-phosphosulfate sulfotransferase (PAPS reductase)/FAD synthetase|nr:phosphoadenosine phosphosulfate reductase family protein [Clostridiales bacterium]
MDWPVTAAYIKAFAEAEGVKLRVSCRVNGFFGEVYRIGASYPVEYEDNGEIKTCPLSDKQKESERLRQEILEDLDPENKEALQEYGYRMKFPAKSGDLARRWCSASLKIDVATTVIRNLRELGNVRQFPLKGSISKNRFCSPQLKREVGDRVIRDLQSLKDFGCRETFPAKSGCHQGRWCSGTLKAFIQGSVTANMEQIKSNVNVLVTSGERRGESAGRAKYNEMEIHTTNATARAHRLVHHWRPVIDYTERDIWEVLKRYSVTPHPCYACGWSRCSCMMCIFGLPKHWAGIKELFPAEYEAVRQDEITLGFTLDNKKTLDEYVGDAKSCVSHSNSKALRQLVTGQFSQTDIYQKEWSFPAGAFHGSDGGPC